MNSLNDAFAQLMRNCQGSPTFMLVKELDNSSSALGAVLIFDEISSTPSDDLLDAKKREGLVSTQLAKALTFAEASKGAL